MSELIEKTIGCPYCGEAISVLVDGSVSDQEYVEDCQVCCQPIVLQVTVTALDEARVEPRREND